MLPVLRRAKARDDLIRIWTYIAADSETAADAMLSRFERVFEMLSKTPHAGRARPDIIEGLRSFAVGNYVVFYRALPDAVAIVRVLNGFQDVNGADYL